MKSPLITFTAFIFLSASALAGDQVIDGEIKKPTVQLIDDRQRARFDRLTNLKKSFLPKMFITSKSKLFK
jgi:hypothetical protein